LNEVEPTQAQRKDGGRQFKSSSGLPLRPFVNCSEAGSQMPTQSTPDELSLQAQVIFRGTVERLQAATMAEVPVTSRTVVVRIDEIIQAPPAMASFAGQSITVQLAPRERVKVGQQAVFYTNGWLAGKSLAVRSIGHRAISDVPRALAGPAATPAQQLASRDLQNRLSEAELVVTGRVASVQAPAAAVSFGLEVAEGQPGGVQRVNEHDPVWREAIIEVNSVEKGAQEPKQISVLFPASDDVLWHDVPKLEPGHEGVFILHRPAESTAAAEAAGFAIEADRPVYTVADPLDIRPSDQLGHVKQLIQTVS